MMRPNTICTLQMLKKDCFFSKLEPFPITSFVFERNRFSQKSVTYFSLET